MARNLNMAVFAAIVAALVISSVSAATYEVGDGLGWNVLPGGAVPYTTWASNHTFHAGDILVFKFANGAHDVAKVTKAAYDACNVTNPISTLTSSPANFTLSSGEHYYICTIDGHCSKGQKLAVNVTGSTSSPPASAPSSPPSVSPAPVLAPEPSSSTPPPAPAAPAPSPSAGPTNYTVGDVAGWNVLSNDSYAVWAKDKTFYVGDILVFNFLSGSHDVAKVTKTNYESCGTSNPIALYTNPPVRFTLNTTGENFFICTFPDHCSKGQKLAINVTGRTATPTSAPAPSPSTSAPTPSTTATPPTSGATPPSGTSPPSTPTPASDVTPPPSPSAATSVGVAGLSVTLLSAAVALFMF
ncbi:hypothetical protein M0R45_003158 [Rubus argutus]|uniref:Phytocyanin domain-containing protein n=1 Tax=Rubus argutus TaxID=59490 RepID=A0AAW1YFK8_RUBAR